MSVRTSVEQVGARLNELRETVSALHLTVTQDKPPGDEAVIVAWLDDTVTELLGELEGAAGHLSPILKSELSEGPLAETRAGLREAHRLLNRCVGVYITELAAHATVERLAQMGRERGRAWHDWVGVVVTAIERCAAPLTLVQAALLDCWSEAAEALARNSVSVHATNIGQQISLREDQFELAGKAT